MSVPESFARYLTESRIHPEKTGFGVEIDPAVWFSRKPAS